MVPGPELTARHAVLVVNHRSRSGSAAIERAVARLRAAGVPVAAEHLVADPARVAPTVRAAIAAGADLIVLGGGDGTVSGAAAELADTSVVLGLLPTGTANDFARTLQIPTGLDRACDTVAHGRLVDVDLGVMGDRYVVNVASVGLSTAVTRALSPRLKQRLGPAAYPVAALKAYRRHLPFAARLEFPDGDHPPVELTDLLQLAVANGRFYGGGSVAAPSAGIDDHVLDVYAIPRGTRWQRAQVARHFTSGAFVGHDHVLHRRTRRVTVTTDPPLPVNVDGELVTRTPQDFGIRRNALWVMVPAGSTAARWDGPSSR